MSSSSAATLTALVSFALQEDLSDRGDVTTQALINPESQSVFSFVARSSGVISGSEAVIETLRSVDETVVCDWLIADGSEVAAGETIARATGMLTSLLVAERTSLNFLQHLSGVATHTARFVNAVKAVGSHTIVRDTRKTLPGYRSLEKAAVVHGGGENHRQGLYDAFLVKDNHLAGRDLEIVAQRCRDFDPTLPLEIEVDSLTQLKTVLDFNPDVVLLDNFSVDEVREAISVAGDTPLEISGGVNLDNVAEYAATNVKYIAVGALTHSAPALDIGCDVGE